MAEAATGGRRFAVVTTTPDLVDSISQSAEAYGHAGRFLGTELTEGDVTALTNDPARLPHALLAACQRAITQRGAEAIVIGGGPLAVAARAISGELPVPIIEPVPASVRLAMAGPGRRSHDRSGPRHRLRCATRHTRRGRDHARGARAVPCFASFAQRADCHRRCQGAGRGRNHLRATLGGRNPSARGRADHREGQYLGRRLAHHARLALLCRPYRPARCPLGGNGRGKRVRLCWASGIARNSPARASRARHFMARRITRWTRASRRAVHPAGTARLWRRALCPSPSARMAADRAAGRPRIAASSASSLAMGPSPSLRLPGTVLVGHLHFAHRA